jgi:hypothetical protein
MMMGGDTTVVRAFYKQKFINNYSRRPPVWGRKEIQ